MDRFNPTFVPCFTEDNDMLFILGDKAPQVQIDASRTGYLRSSHRVKSLHQPLRCFLIRNGPPSGSTIGILEPVSPGVQAAVTELEQKLQDGGFNTSTITVNTLRAITPQLMQKQLPQSHNSTQKELSRSLFFSHSSTQKDSSER